MVLNARLHICRIYESQLLFVWERSAPASVPWPFSQLPGPSAAGLIGVAAGQAVVTAARLFSAVIGGGGERRPATSDLRSNSGQNRGGGSDVFMNYRCINKYLSSNLLHTHSHGFLFRTQVSFPAYFPLSFPPHVFTHIQWPCCDQVRSLFCLIRLDLSVTLLDMTPIYTPSCSRARAVSPWSKSEAGDPKIPRPASCYGHC